VWYNVTVKNRYPLPLIDTLVDQVAGAKYFTKIDLIEGYYEIRTQPGDEEKDPPHLGPIASLRDEQWGGVERMRRLLVLDIKRKRSASCISRALPFNARQQNLSNSIQKFRSIFHAMHVSMSAPAASHFSKLMLPTCKNQRGRGSEVATICREDSKHFETQKSLP